MTTLDNPRVVAKKINSMATKRTQRKSTYERTLNELDKKLEMLQNQESRLVDAYAENVISVEQLKEKKDFIEREKRLVKLAVNKLNDEYFANKPKLKAFDVVRYFKAIKRKAEGASFDFKQQIIRLFASQIIIQGDKVVLKAFIPSSRCLQRPSHQGIVRSRCGNFQPALRGFLPAYIREIES